LEFIVEIVAWSDYNPRADRGNFAWFKFENQFYLNMRTRKKASGDATVLFAFLLAECSIRNGEPFKLSTEFAADMLGRTDKKIIEALHSLEKMGDCVLKRLEAASSVTERRGEERTERTNEPRPAPRPAFDFDRIYMGYPRKEGKKRGLDLCARLIKTEEDYLKLTRAILKYSAHLRQQQTEPKFIKHFDTFMSSWTDWADQDAGQIKIAPAVIRERPPEPEFIPSAPDPESLAIIKQAMGGFMRPMPR
jgi:hypothetical protein